MEHPVPAINTFNLQGGTLGRDAAPPTPHKMSGRRLSKSVARADSQDAEGSKGWGMCEMVDGSGTPRAVRVVQKAEALDGLLPRVGAEVLDFVVPGFHQQQIAVLQQGLQFGDVLYIARENDPLAGDFDAEGVGFPRLALRRDAKMAVV